jgi:hypothetical protein
MMKSLTLLEVRDYGIIADDRKRIVELNQCELELAEMMGRKKATLGRTQVGFTEDTWDKHYYAFCGEIAFCKIMNIYFMPFFDPSHNWTNDKGDALWGTLKVDVKHSIHDPATLAVQKYAIGADVDIYALVTGIPPVLKYQGAILKKDLIKDCNFGKGPQGFENAYCMNSLKLGYYWWTRKKIND